MFSSRKGKQLLIDAYARLHADGPDAPMRLHDAIRSGQDVRPVLQGHPDLLYRLAPVRVPAPMRSDGPSPFQHSELVHQVCAFQTYTSLARLSATCKWMHEIIPLKMKVEAYEAFCERFGRFELLEPTVLRLWDSQVATSASLQVLEDKRLRLTLGGGGTAFAARLPTIADVLGLGEEAFAARLPTFVDTVGKNQYPPSPDKMIMEKSMFTHFVKLAQNSANHDDLQIWFRDLATTTHGLSMDIVVRTPLIAKTRISKHKRENLPVEMWSRIVFTEIDG